MRASFQITMFSLTQHIRTFLWTNIGRFRHSKSHSPYSSEVNSGRRADEEWTETQKNQLLHSSSMLAMSTVFVVFLSTPSIASNPPSQYHSPLLYCTHWAWAHSVSSHSRMVAREASFNSVLSFCSNSLSGIYCFYSCNVVNEKKERSDDKTMKSVHVRKE